MLTVITPALLAGYAIYAVQTEHAVLLGRLTGGTRSDLYGSLAASSGAILGFLITSLSILVALPARAALSRLQKLPAWELLLRALLVAAVLAALALVLSTVGLAIDRHDNPKQWLEAPVAAVAVAAIIQVLIAGTAFAMVVLRASD